MPALSALNMRLRDDYVADCQGGVGRWNKVIEKAGIAFTLKLPHVAYFRHIGEFAEGPRRAPPGKRAVGRRVGGRAARRTLPNEGDRLFIESLMKPVSTAGAYASWISPPRVGIDNKPGDFEYVKLWEA